MTEDSRDSVIHQSPEYLPIKRESLILALLKMCAQTSEKEIVSLYNAAQILRLNIFAEDMPIITDTLKGLEELEKEFKQDSIEKNVVRQSINNIAAMIAEKEQV